MFEFYEMESKLISILVINDEYNYMKNRFLYM